jgi:hypothetical protein
MLNPQIPGYQMMLMIAKARRSELLDEAERDRLIRKTRVRSPGPQARVLASLGGFLISAGKKLQGRYAYRSSQ